jgi:peptide/nickel transport system substrate-binding protein
MLQQRDAHQILANTDFYQEVQGVENIETNLFPTFNPAHITFNYDIPYGRDDMETIGANDDTIPPDFFHDPDVRLGFAYAFDYETYIEEIFSGFAQKFPPYQLPQTVGYSEDLPLYEHDPERAEEHFREAGVWNEGFRITSHNEILPKFTQGNLLMKDSIESLNDNFTINVVEEGESDAVERHGQDPAGWPMEFHGSLPLGSDPDVYYQTYLSESGATGASTHAYEVINPDILDLVNEARTTTNADERAELYQQVVNLLFEDPVVVPVAAPDYMLTHLPCVESVRGASWAGNHFKYFSIDECSPL